MKDVGIVMDRRTELDNCTFVKTVLMITIVFYHSILFWGGNWITFVATPAAKAPILDYLAEWLASFLNYAFVFVSGYLFYYVRHERNGYARFGTFVANKAKRLLIPFLFVGLLWVIPISWLCFKQDLIQTVKQFFLVENAGQLWFLVMLFGVFVVFWPLSNLFAKHHWLGLGVVLAVYAFRFLVWRFIPGYFSIWNITNCLVIFWLGFKFRQGFLDYIRKIPVTVWVVVYTLLLICGECISLPHSTLNKLYGYGMEFIIHAVGAMMAFLLLQKLATCVHWGENKGFAFFAKRSMVIYLFHQQVIYFVVYGLNGVLNPYVHAGLNFVVTMAVSSLIASLLLKFKTTRVLVGEK